MSLAMIGARVGALILAIGLAGFSASPSADLPYLEEYGGAKRSTGYVASWPGLEKPGGGDIVHTATSWFGFSGGVFVYWPVTRTFALLGLTEGIMLSLSKFGVLTSGFFYIYSIPSNVEQYIREAAFTPPLSDSPELSHKGRFANFSQLPATVQDARGVW